MRPLVVLSLVIVAVASLVIALLSILGSGRQGPGEDVVADGPTPAQDEPEEARDPVIRDLDATQPELGENRLPVVVPPGEPGEELRAYVGSWENGIRGLVTGPDGLPLSNVNLMLIRQEQEDALQIFAQVASGGQQEVPPEYGRTREDGTFSFTNLEPADDYRIVAQDKPKRLARYKSDRIPVRVSGLTDWDIQLSAGLICHGYVKDPSGVGIQDATVKLVSQIEAYMPQAVNPNSDRLETTTDHEGYYEFTNVVPGIRNLLVSASGFGSQMHPNITFNANKEVTDKDFTLQVGLTIQGYILGPDHTGLEGASVEAISTRSVMTSRGAATSRPDGYFEIADLTEGQYVLIARKAGYEENRDQTRVEVPQVGEVRIVMAKMGGVLGRVVDGDTNQPLAQAFWVSVRMVQPNSAIYGRAMASQRVTAEAEGEFEVAGLRAGTYVVQAVTGGYAPTFSDTFTVAQGMFTPDIEVRMSKGGTISGRVVDAVSRKPVAGALVATFDNTYIKNPLTDLLGGGMPRMTADAKVRTNAEGEFTLMNLNQEVYQLQISHPDHTTYYLHDRRVIDGGTDELGVIALTPGAVVKGTVYDAAGNPLPGAKVQLSSQNTGTMQSYQARTNNEGRYEIPRVAEGAYRLTATRSGPAGQTNPFDAILEMKNSEVTIHVADGTTTTQNLNLGDS